MKELNDDEIRVIGEDGPTRKKRSKKFIFAAIVVCALVALGLLLLLPKCGDGKSQPADNPYFDSTTVVSQAKTQLPIRTDINDTIIGITRQDTVVNDIPLSIYHIHNLKAGLRVGELKVREAEPNILMALMAADIRADNMEIVSAFVLHGEPVSRGIARLGYCAIIDGEITLGVDTETSLYERAIERKGDFFRQFPLVANHRIVENRIKNKAFRRALVMLDGRAAVVMSQTEESLHDFSQSLVDIGAETAINLVGSKMRTGWIALADSIIRPDEVMSEPMPSNVNYIVWTK